MKINAFGEDIFENSMAFVHDWYSLSVLTGLYTNALSYISREGTERHSSRITLNKGRVVYKSDQTLKKIQERLSVLLNNEFAKLSEQDKKPILAYVKDVKALEVLNAAIQGITEQTEKTLTKKCAFDIRKYFDNITPRHIIYALQQIGFTRHGASLIARYCVRSGGLQQGSICSPVISNIVGMVFFDRHIRKFLEEEAPDVTYSYHRYCDNLVLLTFGEVPDGFIDRYKAKCREICTEGGFRTHKWQTIPYNHPRVNMRWLGVQLGVSGTKIERSLFDIHRGMLFRLATDADPALALRNMGSSLGFAESNIVGDMTVINHMLLVLRGKVAYVSNVNKKQGLQLSKLLKLVALRSTAAVPNRVTPPIHHASQFRNVGSAMPDALLLAVKRYKNYDESVTAYIDRIAETRREFFS